MEKAELVPPKPVVAQIDTSSNVANVGRIRPSRVNPYSVANITASLIQLGRKVAFNDSGLYYYYEFDPNLVTGEILQQLEKDTLCQIMDFPFADVNVYDDTFSANFQNNVDNMKNGKLYIVFNYNSHLNLFFQNFGASFGAVKKDELYLPNADDETLILQALITAGIANYPDTATMKRFRPCLLKQPRGKVTYLDQARNINVPVPQIQVFAFFFGIPIITYTNDRGDYYTPWRFSMGTIIGTHARNWRANIKPLDVTGGVLAAIVQIRLNFIIGSRHLYGWYSACDMRNNINISFSGHNQRRYWAQLLHATKLHHDYAVQDGILPAPPLLTIYAKWSAGGDGTASAPMLGHVNGSGYAAAILSIILDVNITINAPNLLNLLTGLLPDMTFSENSTQNPRYSETLMQTAFHEFGHASYYRKVGDIYWIKVIGGIVDALLGSCSTYGCASSSVAGNIALSEAWAEYIGKQHHRRIHPNQQTYIGDSNALIPPPIDDGYNGTINAALLQWRSYPDALEYDRVFVGNYWIPTGLFYDLTDNFNSNEPNDVIQGFTTAQMYNLFSPNVESFCDYGARFLTTYTNIAVSDYQNVDNVINLNFVYCP